MNTAFKYIIGLDLLNCHAKFHGDMISRSRENDIGSCYFWKFSGYFQNAIVISSLSNEEPDVKLNGCRSCKVTIMIPVLFINLN